MELSLAFSIKLPQIKNILDINRFTCYLFFLFEVCSLLY